MLPTVADVEWPSILTAAVVAVYAMVGGALMASAITAPQNCKIVLVRVIRPILMINVAIVMTAGGVAPLLGFTTPVAQEVLNIGDWVTVGMVALGAIYYLCKWIVRVLLPQ